MEYLKFVPIALLIGGLTIALLLLVDIVKHGLAKERKK